jgi:dephospho-CoA kinase
MINWRNIFSRKQEEAKQRRAERSRELKETQEQADVISESTKNIIDLTEQLRKKHG